MSFLDILAGTLGGVGKAGEDYGKSQLDLENQKALLDAKSGQSNKQSFMQAIMRGLSGKYGDEFSDKIGGNIDWGSVEGGDYSSVLASITRPKQNYGNPNPNVNNPSITLNPGRNVIPAVKKTSRER